MDTQNLKNIKKTICDNRIYWFNFKGNKIVVNSSKNNSKKILLKKLKKSKDLLRLEITFHKGNGVFQGGPIKLNFKTFFYDKDFKKLKKKLISGKNGPIWIDYHWLKLNNINSKKKLNSLIKKLVIKILKKNLIKVPGINKLSLI